MKTCLKCGAEKPLSEFYRHAGKADGVKNTCKRCCMDYNSARLREDRERRSTAKAARRATRPQRIAAYTTAWRKKHPKRRAAHNAANRAGLVAPTTCEQCERPARVEKHHADYDRPLFVVWLCKPCHAIADKARRALEAF
jgi:hypothetical protein